MFVAEEQCLDVGFAAARVRLANLLSSGALITSSAYCYQRGVTGLALVGPQRPAPGVSRLVEVQFGGPVIRGDSATLSLRWRATGPGGVLFPALDADLMLTALSEDVTMLRLVGAYRAPPGQAGAGLDRAVLQRVATATIQAFIRCVAGAVVHPAAAAASGPESPCPSPAPEMP